MRVTLLDYGAGNLHSLATALRCADVETDVEADPRRALGSDLLVLPGVGAFAPAAAHIAPARDAMRDAIRAGHPVVGICLGMQLLFDDSEEGPGMGLGVIPGKVTRLSARRVPHIGWGSIDEWTDASGPRLELAYYANGFACRPDDLSVVHAWSSHESDRFAAVVRSGNAVGVQFHPEKSSAPGVSFLRGIIDTLLGR